MRRTLATLAALAVVVLLSACGDADDQPSGAPASAVASAAVSEPVADTSGEVPADGGTVAPEDITGLKVTRADKAQYPEANHAAVDVSIKNSATYAVTYHLTIAIFQGNTQVTSVQVDTTEDGPTLPGKTLHLTGVYGAAGDLPAGAFTAQVTEAQRTPA